MTPTLAICSFNICQLFFITAFWVSVKGLGRVEESSTGKFPILECFFCTLSHVHPILAEVLISFNFSKQVECSKIDFNLVNRVSFLFLMDPHNQAQPFLVKRALKPQLLYTRLYLCSKCVMSENIKCARTEYRED